MIPPDVASSLRQILPDAQAATNAGTQPVAQAARIADVLSNLVPGQRVLAEIQALLPNGNYRAIVGQRDITLALPFSAKAGDSIELEVKESDGKLTLAFVANRTEAASAKAGQESVSTTLTSTGKLIGNLMTGIDGEGKRAPATPLNGNQALVASMPKNAADLVPVLKQALTQSGMFYEAHQAKWVAGQLPTAALRQEPQAKYSPPPVLVTVNSVFEAKIATTSNVATTANLTNPAIATTPVTATNPANPNTAAQQNLSSTSAPLASAPSELVTAEASQPTTATQIKATPTGANANPLPPNPSIAVQQKLNAAYNNLGSSTVDLTKVDLNAATTQRADQAAPMPNNLPQTPLKGEAATPAQTLPATASTESSAATNASAKPEAVSSLPAQATRSNEQANTAPQPGNPIPRELTPIVQQQLDGLANQNFAWQGQVWPGQQMQWEIGENPANARGQNADMAQWQTRLKLALPMLGGIDAVLQLRPNGEVGIAINTDAPSSEAQLKERADQLRSQFEAAGLSLSKLFIQHAQPAE
ncbi:MAG: flagellar hook-length control protein FliK [Rhodocyclaceae bacterium]|nr:flagellar hook-length control protein FliK [Rhodocyclaceae bacterium]